MEEQEKYKFNSNDPESWSKMPRPHLDEAIVRETLRIGGVNRHGEPRFRWVWGMEEEVFMPGEPGIPEGWYIKYQLGCNKTVTGYSWTDTHGTHFAKEQKDVPIHAIAIPVERIDQIGTPRWILEEWKNEGDNNGIYDRDGYYFHRKIVRDDLPEDDSYLRPYRAPDDRDLEILAGYVQATAELTEKDITAGVAKERADEAEASAKLKQELQEDIVETLLETIPSLKNMPKPSDAVIQRAWSQIKGK